MGLILGTIWLHEGLPDALEARASKNAAPGDDRALENYSFGLIWGPRGGAKIVKNHENGVSEIIFFLDGLPEAILGQFKWFLVRN